MNESLSSSPLMESSRGRDNGYSMEMKTLQSSTFKTLVEGLKDILNDTVLEFDHTGMKIVALNTSQNVMVHLVLRAENLEYYYCDRMHRVGINMLHFQKLIKSATTKDTLTLFLDSSDMNNLGIKLDSNDRSHKTTYKLRTMDLNQPFTVPHMEFHKTITMHSPFFQKICRDMDSIAEFVEIKDVNNQLIFTCEGDFCSQETILCDNKKTGIHMPAEEETGDDGEVKINRTKARRKLKKGSTSRSQKAFAEEEGEEKGEDEEEEGEGGEGGGDDEVDENENEEAEKPSVMNVGSEGNTIIEKNQGSGSGNDHETQNRQHRQDRVTDPHEIVQGVFSLKHLTIFTKFTNLSKTVDLLMKNDFPLLVRYMVSSLGEIKLLLCEKDDDNSDH